MNNKQTYQELMSSQEQAISDFPIVFAFSGKQLTEALKKLNAKREDCLTIRGGGIIRKSDATAWANLLLSFDEQLEEAKKDGDFLLSALVYELHNHEFTYTGDPRDAMDCLSIDKSNEREMEILEAAINQAWAESSY